MKFLFFVLFPFFVFSQKNEKIYPVLKDMALGGKFGFKNSKNEMVYDYIFNYCDRLELDYRSRYFKKLIKVSYGHKNGVIDIYGNQILDTFCFDVSNYNDYLNVFVGRKSIEKNGDRAIQEVLIDSSGNVLLADTTYANNSKGCRIYDREKLIVFIQKRKIQNTLIKVYDFNFKIKFIFEDSLNDADRYTCTINKNYIKREKYSGSLSRSILGFIVNNNIYNLNGDKIIDSVKIIYDDNQPLEGESFDNIFCYKNGNCFILNENLKEVIPYDSGYKQVNNCKRKESFNVSKDSTTPFFYSLLDYNGHKIIDSIFNHPVYSFQKNYYQTKMKEGKIEVNVVLDSNFKVVLKTYYEYGFDNHSNGRLIYKTNNNRFGLWFNNKILIENLKDLKYEYRDNTFLYEKMDGSTGWLDSNGIRLNKKYTVYEEQDELGNNNVTMEGYKIYKVNGLYGLKNPKGEKIIPPKYIRIRRDFDYFKVVNKFDKEGAFNLKGDLIVPIENISVLFNPVFNFFSVKKEKGMDTIVFVPE